MYKHALLIALLLGLTSVQAADAPPPPPLPDSVPEEDVPPQDQELQPEVSIINREAGTFEEFRQNGQIYMIKVTPKKGYPYYLIDTDGDGSLETRRNSLDDPEVIQWRLLEW